jgi:hypothetical protein
MYRNAPCRPRISDDRGHLAAKRFYNKFFFSFHPSIFPSVRPSGYGSGSGTSSESKVLMTKNWGGKLQLKKLDI